MGVILVDLAQEDRDLYANWWTWRPAIELIRSFDLIDDERLERMGYSGVGAELNAEQAHIIGRRLKEEVLPRIQSKERVLLDLSATGEPDNGTLYDDNWLQNYSASREWLEEFANFCLTSQGFRVS